MWDMFVCMKQSTRITVESVKVRTYMPMYIHWVIQKFSLYSIFITMWCDFTTLVIVYILLKSSVKKQVRRQAQLMEYVTWKCYDRKWYRTYWYSGIKNKPGSVLISLKLWYEERLPIVHWIRIFWRVEGRYYILLLKSGLRVLRRQ